MDASPAVSDKQDQEILPIFTPAFEGNERSYLSQCMESGWISSQGPFVRDFEDAFARWHGVAHAVTASNCTTALHLALVALGIGVGDEVLCPDLTFIAPANMIELTGATAVLVDVEAVSWAIDPEKAAERITERTRAILVVHPFGHAADMDPLLALAEKHRLFVVEDNAEAIGATYKGKLLGTLGDAGCFSFFANKIMTTGEGGMVLCSDDALDQRLRVLRDHGMSRTERYLHVDLGFNYRMTNMQAAVGLAQLERIGEILARRAAQEAAYKSRLGASPVVQWRPKTDYCETVHWLATITLPDPETRRRVAAALTINRIDSRPMVFPVHHAEHWRGRVDPAEFPVSTSVSERSLHLPSGTALRDDEIERVCDIVLSSVEAI